MVVHEPIKVELIYLGEADKPEESSVDLDDLALQYLFEDQEVVLEEASVTSFFQLDLDCLLLCCNFCRTKFGQVRKRKCPRIYNCIVLPTSTQGYL